MTYVDCYLLPISKKNINAYKKMAQIGCKVWLEHGALDYKECVLEDAKVHCGVPFPKAIKTKPGETVVFAYVVFKSRAHRDKVNTKVMTDPRITESADFKKMPFDANRMIYSGFTTLVGK